MFDIDAYTERDCQQYHALMAENGVLPVDDAGQSALAAQIGAAVAS